jgi:PadR family transcriptional regulator, regulatory protein PadR
MREEELAMGSGEMKGFLSYLILWMLSKRSMSGSEVAEELERRRGTKPSPGTVYPALKELKERGFISSGEGKVYSLTRKGEKEVVSSCGMFCRMFYDFKEMFHCCPLKRGK